MATGTHVSATHKIISDSDFKNPLILNRDEISKLASESLDALQKILSPLQRTGDLEQSWHIIANSTSFSLWSTDWAAHSIQTGFTESPPKDILIDWMKTKSEFQGMDDKEQSRVAFAIRLAIRRGDSPGPQSTIGNLDPSGERRFDYMKQAKSEIERIVHKRILSI